jgi:hypothetical protein
MRVLEAFNWASKAPLSGFASPRMLSCGAMQSPREELSRTSACAWQRPLSKRAWGPRPAVTCAKKNDGGGNIFPKEFFDLADTVSANLQGTPSSSYLRNWPPWQMVLFFAAQDILPHFI